MRSRRFSAWRAGSCFASLYQPLVLLALMLTSVGVRAQSEGPQSSPPQQGPAEELSEDESGAPQEELETPPPPVESPQGKKGELAGLPVIAGNDTFGFLVGVTGTYTHFAPDYRPFRFRGQLTAVTSIQGSDDGVQFPLQNIDLRLDFPGLRGGRVRLYTLVRYQRILDMGYWGLGNEAPGNIPADYEGPRERFFQYEKWLGEGRLFMRYKMRPHLDLVAGPGARLVKTGVLPDSRLARDLRDVPAARALLYGTGTMQIYDALLGILVDTRDDEINPSSGSYHELSVRGGVGPASDRPIHYGSVTVHTRWFWPLAGERLVFGARAMADIGFGAMPLIELGTVGGYFSHAGPAGLEANRGLPYGRQLGQVKLLNTAELRSTFYHFSLFGQQLALGAATFLDASRVWAKLPAVRSLDGGPVMRISVGGGPRVVWGRGLVLRFDVGFAPGAGVDGRNNVSTTLDMDHTF
ncbi:MAG: BamA/TamA family outer membrane protein [Myxococcales bacterium]